MDDAKGKILVVDDEELIIASISRKLQDEGHSCVTASDGEQALENALAQDFDVVLLDIRMPAKSGMEVLKRIAADRPDTCVVMLTAVSEVQTVVEAMKLGAYDYVTKPFDLNYVVLTVERALERRKLILENKEYRRLLEETIEQQEGRIRHYCSEAIVALTREEMALERSTSIGEIEEQIDPDEEHLRIARMLVTMAEMREPYARGHSERVSMIASEIAIQLDCPCELVRDIRLAGIVCDIGKVAIPDHVLLKPGHLTPAEYSNVKRHPATAIEILRYEGHFNGALSLIESHHEWYNGKGYPSKLKGKDIPLGARILAVADAYEAMTSPRPHRPNLSNEEAIKVLKKGAGTQWDPHVVDAFLQILKRRKKTSKLAVPATQ